MNKVSEDQANRKANSLVNETSPYLRQHAYNPVQWFAWGEEALQKAKQEDKPILLSIGYSACHWCHVMEHESFEDANVAKVMNEHFVPIKVDREERPDIDDIYMKSVQMMTGHGGWPLTVFITPDLKPFYGGTYFPPQDRHGLPSFTRVLVSVASSWTEQREQIESGASELSHYLGLINAVDKNNEPLKDEQVISVVDRILSVFDRTYGGLGGAPKFPQASSLELIMRMAVGQRNIDDAKKAECLQLIVTTLDKMAIGGIHDQLGGGFARYSVDRQWLIPHFEKMLYDNALLASVYLQGYQITKRPYWLATACDTLDFVLNELTADNGAFYSSLDADSEGEEGKFYVWTDKEITDLLGEQEAKFFQQVFGVTKEGNFEGQTNNLHFVDLPEKLAHQFGLSYEDFMAKLLPLKTKVLEARTKRIRPGLDDKVLTSWNALMISAFAQGYAVTGNNTYLKAAVDAANFILNNLFVNNRLLRTWGKGQAKLNAYLDDYAYFIAALIDLAAIDFNPLWIEKAITLNQVMIDQFFDQDDFYYTSKDHEKLLTRTKNINDGPNPSATSVAIFNLLRLQSVFNDKSYGQKAEQVLGRYASAFEKAPDQFAHMAAALDFYLNGKKEIVLVADKSKSDWAKMLHTIHSTYLPNAVCLLKDAGNTKTAAGWLSQSPLTANRDTEAGKATVYICESYACKKPITAIAELETELGS
jgi:uncharacterized protein YyaL (SSP411 family)